MSNKYYIYAYLDPRRELINGQFSHEPFYIGRGTGSRLNYHITEAIKLPESISPSYAKANRINLIKVNKIRSIISNGFQPIIIKFIDGLSLEESKIQEIKLISQIGRSVFGDGPLTNLTEGGEGRVVCHAGRFNPFYGKTHSTEFRNKMSLIHKGKIISKEQRETISLKLKGVKKSRETVEKHRTYMRKLYNSDCNNPIFNRLGEKNSKRWIIQSLDGEILEIISLRKFCKENNLNVKTLMSAYNKKRPTKSGWIVLNCT